jgi:serine protease inhibitor
MTQRCAAHHQHVSRRDVLALGLLAMGAGPVLAACSSTSTPPQPSGPDRSAGPIPVSNVKRADVALSGAPDLSAVVDGMSAFAAHLHATTATASANYTMSPLSIAVAFGMLRAGSRGETAKQLDTVFGFPATSRPEGSPHRALNALTAQLVTPHLLPGKPQAQAPVVAIANGVWVADGFAPLVHLAFLDLLAAQYGAHPQGVDFTTPAAAAAINAWVTDQTHGRINQLFDSLDPSTLMVLANAVYLKATWVNQFIVQSTQPGSFTTAAGSTVQAHLMSQTLEGVPYAENGQWQRITLPYVGDELTMHVVLPRTVASDRAALSALLPIATAPTAADRTTAVELELPRWDTATGLDLLTALASLGATDLSDLAGIAGGVYVSQAVHRANITVDENGSEAAAVTGIAVGTSAVISRTTVTVNRPFVWAVMHEPTQTPVFVGHVVNPTA